MTSVLTRSGPRLKAGLSLALLAALVGGTAAHAAEPTEDPTIVASGHADLMWLTKADSGEPTLAVNSDDLGVVKAGDLAFHVKPSVAERTANSDAIAALGVSQTDTFYLAPERYSPGQLFIGFGFDLNSFAADSVEVERTISHFEGPGDFAMWHSAEGDAPLVSTSSNITSFTSIGYHEHSNWGFTAEGTYSFDVTAKVTDVASGEVTTTPAEHYTFIVREEAQATEPVTDVELNVTGAAGHYHTGDVATLTATQSPAEVSDHLHWFTRANTSAEWAIVPEAHGSTYGFVVTAEQQVKAVVYGENHAVLAESTPVDIHVDDHGNTPGVGPEITVAHEATEGALTLSVDAAHRRVTMDPLALTEQADRLVSHGAVGGITVTDTRSGDLGWSASGRLRNFVSPVGETLDGKHLGWQPTVVSASNGQTVSAGAKVDPGFETGNGVKGWSALGKADAQHSRGTAVLGADLTIEAPTTTAIGEYTGVLLITVI
ncbi:choice-of-anchor M domain-containing protein [Leucobacter chinensis]|uniref:choice-of-anchor M domain-containing protein n=1 Tax=Leucobacter chinensis TaxID=2851010 RepID=UPI001C225265|nr:choice-of-anchor M domain-containing protein [Leucobacter chinensis]